MTAHAAPNAPPQLSTARLLRACAALALAAAAVALAPAPGRAASGEPASGHAVRLHDHRLVELSATLDGVAPAERARAAGEALARAFDGGADRTRVVTQGERAAVWLGEVPVLALGPEDAAAAGEPDAAALAAALARDVERVAADERRRGAVSDLVYALSMVVFSALVAFLVARRAGALALTLAQRIEQGDAAAPAVSVAGVELVSAAFVRGALPLAMRLGRFALYVAAGWAWLLFAASLFSATGPLGARLTAAVVGPAAELLGRLGRGVPIVLVLAAGGAFLALVLRAARLHFDEVARGETASPWVPPELARPTGVLVRAGVIALALVFAPAVLGLGGEEGMGGLARAALLALGIGASPLAATLALGVVAVYGRALRPGDDAEVGGRRGRVLEVTLLEVRLEDDEGGLVRVPHLATLLRPTRVAPAGRGRPR